MGSDRGAGAGPWRDGPSTPGRALPWTGHSLRQVPGDHTGLISLSWPHRMDCCDHLKHVRHPPPLLPSSLIPFQDVSSILSKRCWSGFSSVIYERGCHKVFCNPVPFPGPKCLGKGPSHGQRKCWRHWSLMLVSSLSVPGHCVTGGLGGCTGSHFLPSWSF